MFSDLHEKFFGGNNNSQQNQQTRQNEYAMRYAQQQSGQGRADLQTLYGAADNARNYGYNQALNLQAQAMPMQANYFQGGNMAAQNAIIGGQPFTYQAPQIDPMYFRQQDFRMPYWQQPQADYVPILNRPVGHNNQRAQNIGQQGVHADQGLQTSVGTVPATSGAMPMADPRNYQGRFGRFV